MARHDLHVAVIGCTRAGEVSSRVVIWRVLWSMGFALGVWILLTATSGPYFVSYAAPLGQTNPAQNTLSEATALRLSASQAPLRPSPAQPGLQLSPAPAIPSRHGGTSFTSRDKRHHIEGVLLPGGRFRLYVYGADLKPVSAAALRQIGATVQWGDSELASRTALLPVADATALETASVREVKLPITLTLRIVFAAALNAGSVTAGSVTAGSSSPAKSGAKPELFTFKFTQFSAPAEDSSAKPPAAATPPSQGPSERPMPPTDRSADTLEHRPGH